LDKTIVTALLVIAGVISAVFVFNSIYPAIVQSSDAMTSMERRADDRLKSHIQIIHAAKSGSTTLVWVKNVGSLRVAPVEACDIFFGAEGNFVRIPYGTDDGEWQYTLENAAEWTPSATVKITIKTTASPGVRYFIKVVLVNGVSDEYYFSG
jgi:archaellum component FlaF (FlaF/FlaG flagellin family)